MLALPGVSAVFDSNTLVGSELEIVTGRLPAGAGAERYPPAVV
jgi:hypothetical protein